MDNKTIFDKDIKNLPFIECIDKDNLYKEYLTAKKIPDFEMYLYSINELEKVRELEGTNGYDYTLQEFYTQFISEIKSKSLSDNAYKFNIKETSTFRHLTSIQDAYNHFLETLRNRQDNSIDRYKEPELQAKNIVRLLQIFNDEVKTKIIENIISLTNENDISEFIRLKYNNENYNKDNNSLLEFFKTELNEFKITLKPTNEQLPKDEDFIEKKEGKYSVPQKIKILDELNIKGWLQGKDYTVFQIEQLLSDLFDVTDRTVRSGFSNSKHESTAQGYLKELKNLKANR
jgi:hypothetical protein